MVTGDLGFGIFLNVLAHLMIQGLLFLTRKELGRWAAAGSAYAIVSVIQLLVLFVAPGIAMLGGVIFAAGMQLGAVSEGGKGFVMGLGALAGAHGLCVGIYMAVLFERTTGISLITGRASRKGGALVKPTPGGRVRKKGLEAEPAAIPAPIRRIPTIRQPRPPGRKAKPRLRLPRLTWKTWLYLAGGLAMAGAAWLSNNPLLYFPACAVAVLLLAEYVIDLYAAAQMPRIEVRREVPVIVGEDDLIEVKLVLKNRGGTVNNLVLVDHFAPEELPYRECRVVVGRLPAGSTGECAYEVNCWRRGVWRVGPLELRRESPLSIFKNRSQRLESSLIRVHPHLYPAPSWSLALGGPRERVGLGTVDKAGWSSEFYGVREYQPGDPRRLIHWPSTARCMTLMVKELEMAADYDITAVIDLNRLVVSGTGKHTTFEYMIKIMGALCRELLRKCPNLSLAAVGSGLRVLQCTRGMMDFPLVLDFLTDLQPDGLVPLELSLPSLHPRLRKGSTLIVPMQRPNLRILDNLYFMQSHGIEPRVLLFDSSTFQPRPSPAPLLEAEKGAYHAALEQLRSRNVRVAGVDREKGPSQAVFFGGWG